MPNEPRANPDDDFIARLAQYDDEVVAGGKNPSDDSGSTGPASVDSDGQDRMEQVKPVLHMLESIWPRDSGARAPRRKKSWKKPRFPTWFGRFRIDGELGRGGFGVVFKAFDPTLDRSVALKMPRPEVIVSPALAERFFAEARTSASLKHPNIVNVYEAGELGPTCYIVSELCRGPSLAGWLEARSEPVSTATAARLIAVLAEAVAYSQKLGILHRDIKPSNILIDPPVDDPFVITETDTKLLGFIPKISDFGLAKVLEESSDDGADLEIVGTPEYMAPEQAEGRRDLIGSATDVYALGSVLYELLVGRPPHLGKTKQITLQNLKTKDPRAMRAFRSDVPLDLEAICLRCLQKDPTRRYPTASDLASDLRRFLAGMPTEARPLTRLERIARFTKRKPAESVLVAVTCFFMAVSVVGAWLHTSRFETAQARVEEAQQIVQEQRESAQYREQRIGDLEYVADIRHAQQAYDNADVEECLAILSRHFPVALEADRRGFDWYRLWRLCHEEEMLLEDQRDSVYCIDFSPDDKQIVASTAAGELVLWDLGANSSRQIDQPHRGEVNHVAYSHDGQRIISAGDDTIVQIRSADGQLLHTLRGHEQGVRVAAPHPNRSWVATCCHRQIVRLWDYESGELIRTWTLPDADDDLVDYLFYSPDGAEMIAATSKGALYRIDVDGKSKPERLAQLQGSINGGAYLPNENAVIVGGQNRFLTVVALTSGKVLRRWRAHTDWIHSLAVSPDGQRCATAGKDRFVKVWDIQTGRMVSRIIGHRGRVWGVDFSNDGEWLASGGADRAIRVFNTRKAGEHPVLASFSSRPFVISPTPVSKTAAIGLGNGQIEIWDLVRWERLHSLEMSGAVVGLASCPTGFLAGCTLSGDICVWKWDGSSYSEHYRTTLSDACGISFCPGGKRFAVSTASGDVVVFLTDEKYPILTTRAHSSAARIRFAPHGSMLVTSGYDATAKLWDAKTLELVNTIDHHDQNLHAAAFDSTGSLLSLASADSTAGIFRIPEAKLISSLHGQSDEVMAVSFSRNDRTLITGYRNGGVRTWDTSTMQEVLNESTGLDELTDMEYLPDGQILLLAGREQSTERWVVIEWTRVGKDLTPKN